MIENRLRMHAEYMRRLMATGLDLETASARAYAMIKAPGSKCIEPGSAPDDGHTARENVVPMNKRQILEREIERVDTEIKSSKGVRHRIVPLQAIRVLLDYELNRDPPSRIAGGGGL